MGSSRARGTGEEMFVLLIQSLHDLTNSPTIIQKDANMRAAQAACNVSQHSRILDGKPLRQCHDPRVLAEYPVIWVVLFILAFVS